MEIKSAAAPIAAEVFVPSSAAPPGLFQLASAAESALGEFGPAALLAVEQVARLVGGRAAAELPAVPEPFPPAVVRPVLRELCRLAAAPPADREPFPLVAALPAVEQLAAAVLPVAHEPCQLAAVLPAVGQLAAAVLPVAHEPCQPAAAPPAAREPSPPLAGLPAVGRPAAHGPCRLAAAPPAVGQLAAAVLPVAHE